MRSRHTLTATAFAAFTWLFASPILAQPANAQPANAQPANDLRGNEGESCRARADCASGLACVNNQCVKRDTAPPPPPQPVPLQTTPPIGPDPRARPPAPAPAPWATPAGPPPPPLRPIEEDWWDFKIGRGTVPYLGLTAGPGFAFAYIHQQEQATAVDPSFFFALKGGFLFEETDLQIEVSPYTWVPFTTGPNTFQANISIGSLRNIDGDFYWPTHFGLGVVTGNAFDPLFLTRFDLLGFVYQMGHVLFEFNLPSVRVATNFDTISVFAFEFNTSVSYAFTTL